MFPLFRAALLRRSVCVCVLKLCPADCGAEYFYLSVGDDHYWCAVTFILINISSASTLVDNTA